MEKRVEVPVEKRVEVEIERTPPACIEALDLAAEVFDLSGQGFRITAQVFPLAGQAIEAAAAREVGTMKLLTAQIVAHAEDFNAVSEELPKFADPMRTAVTECRSLAAAE